MTAYSWQVPLKHRARIDIENLMIRCVAYVFRHVSAEMIHVPNVGERFRVTLDGPKCEPFTEIVTPGPRTFDVYVVGREMTVTTTDPDSLTYAVARGWADACCRAWGTEVRG